MTLRKLTDTAQLGIIAGATMYVGYSLMGLTLRMLAEYLRP